MCKWVVFVVDGNKVQILNCGVVAILVVLLLLLLLLFAIVRKTTMVVKHHGYLRIDGTFNVYPFRLQNFAQHVILIKWKVHEVHLIAWWKSICTHPQL